MGSRLAAAAAYVLAVGVLLVWEPTADDDPWATLFFVGVNVGVGVAIGRWWATGLALVWVPVVAASPQSELVWWFELLGSGGLSAITIASGVLARKLIAAAQRSADRKASASR